jgi:predicted nucleotidyltransferase component of viral defense system
MAGSIISSWVEEESNPLSRAFREAVHTILYAISHSQAISAHMIMKGAILLSIRYHCMRYTKDIDFSTDSTVQVFNKDQFLSDFSEALILATEALDYGLDCRIQSWKIKPPNPDAAFPTMKLKVGYAYKHDDRSHRRLLAQNCSQVVEIDYSFNEATYSTEEIILAKEGVLLAYGFTDLVAEKIRAILQQPQRNRIRRQDIYDLYCLLHRYQLITNDEKHKIIDSLVKKAQARNVRVNRNSMKNPEVIERSRKEYHTLQDEIADVLPDFGKAYHYVQSFYESLPWDDEMPAL